MTVYRRAPSNAMERPLTEAGPVLAWDDYGKGGAVIFLCPCGDREVYVTSPPHSIEFDDDGRLTLDGSVGGSGRWRGENLCHFLLKAGEVEICGDAKCPGGATP